MFLSKLLAVCMLFCLLCVPARAAQMPCFGEEALPDTLTGICITQTPQAGQLLLGSRVLQAGDVLTAEQAEQMMFSGEEGQWAYLPVFSQTQREPVVVTLGKKGEGPVAQDSALETYKNLPTTGKLKATGENLLFTVTRQPKRGSVVLGEDGSFTYTPKKNKVGIDSFTYTATDPQGRTSREATVTITILKPSDSTQYTDTQGLDCRFTAEWLKNTGIFVGETVDHHLCFQPDKPVTRGEFVTMLVKALDLPVDEKLEEAGYQDEIPGWLQPYLAAALRSGLTAGLPQQTFGPGEPILAGEAAVMLENVLDGTVEALASQEEDIILTRAQAAQILYQASQEQKNAEFQTACF